jgi:hypothetical protein
LERNFEWKDMPLLFSREGGGDEFLKLKKRTSPPSPLSFKERGNTTIYRPTIDM